MKYINPHEFYLETNGKVIDVDGSYGGQCWDLFAYFCQKYCGRTFSCIATGYVIDLWNYFNECGLSEYFDKVNANEMIDGDWSIWQGPCQITNHSHIAMFRLDNKDNTGVFLTQNPNGNPNYVHQMSISYNGLLGALRPKTNQPSKILAPNPVNQDKNVNQVKVLCNDTIYCRLSPDNTIENKVSDNFVKIGYYNILSETNGQGYHWYEIEKDRWIAQVEGYVEYIPKYVEPVIENKPIEEEKGQVSPIIPSEPETLENEPKNEEIEVHNRDKKNILLEIINKILEYLRKRFIK